MQSATDTLTNGNGHHTVTNGNGHHALDQAPDASGPIARIIGRDLLEEELRSVRESMERLEEAQARHSHALLGAATQWSEQIGYLRARTQGLGELTEAQRIDLLARIDQMQGELTRLGAFAIQTQIQERMINELEQGHGRTAEALGRLANANTELIDRFDHRFAQLESRATARFRGMILSILTIAISVVMLAFATNHLWSGR